MSNPILQTDVQDIIAAVLGTILGFIGSFTVEWYKKRRNPKEVESDASLKINNAAQKNVETARTVIELLEDRLTEERIYNTEQIDKSKRDCEYKIDEVKIFYEKQIEQLRLEVDETRRENIRLNIALKQMDIDKEKLFMQVVELTARLKKYENKLSQ